MLPNKNTFIIISGWFLLIFGIIGLVLPFLQGILLIALGVAILSARSETFKRWFEMVKKKYPKVFTILNKKNKSHDT